MTGRNLEMTVNVSLPHPGACQRIFVHGHGANELHAALLEIVGRHILDRSLDAGAVSEIDRLFTHPNPSNALNNLWVTQQYRSRGGAPQRVAVAIGSAANELRDILVAIVRNRVSSYDACNQTVAEINDLFEQSPP